MSDNLETKCPCCGARADMFLDGVPRESFTGHFNHAIVTYRYADSRGIIGALADVQEMGRAISTPSMIEVCPSCGTVAHFKCDKCGGEWYTHAASMAHSNQRFASELRAIKEALLAWLAEVEQIAPEFKGPYTTATDRLIKMATEIRERSVPRPPQETPNG